jgi:molecular chaperone GrpE
VAAHRGTVAHHEPQADADDAPDLHTFYSALIALREEVKRDSRQSRRVVEESHERTRQTEGRLSSELGALKERIDDLRELSAAAAAQNARKELLEMIELRDRVALGPAALSQAGRRWSVRIKLAGLRPLFDSLRQGQEMLLERFDELLRSRGVEAIPSEGLPFDPSRMKAVAVDPSRRVREGTVTQELRRGYERNGDVLRPAEVRVSRREAR